MPNNLLHHSSGEKFSRIDSDSISEIQEKLTDLKVSRQNLSRLMNLETWAIVSTMEDLSPGFWHRFMGNRQLAVKNSIQQPKNFLKIQQQRLTSNKVNTASTD